VTVTFNNLLEPAEIAMENQSQHDDVTVLIKTIHEDRLTVKEKEKRDAWTKYVSLMIVALAVLTGYASLKAGGFGSQVMLNQAKASDQWSFYQAKGIKRSLKEMEATLVGTPETQAKAKSEAERYKTEQDGIYKVAKGFEEASQEAARHGGPLGNGIAALQIAIALASVCMIAKRKALWLASGVLGLAGLGYVVYGLFLV
jgi:hypothetical protein